MSFTTGSQYEQQNTMNMPVRTTERWQGGGAAAAMTKVTKAAGKNIASIAYAGSTGLYTITFRYVGAQWLGMQATIAKAAGAAGQKVANEVAGTYSATTKSVQIQVTDVATPTAADLATSEFLNVCCEWSDSDQP